MSKFNAAFKRWFKDSLVADENDKPLVVYHGTPFSFSKFEKAKRGQKNQFGPSADSLEGFFFTSDPEMAAEFAWQNGDQSGSIMPVYLSLQNPVISDFMLYSYDTAKFGEMLRVAKREGHDGFVCFMTFVDKIAPVFVAFEPEQIKSVFNDETFDADDPDIRSNPRRKR